MNKETRKQNNFLLKLLILLFWVLPLHLEGALGAPRRWNTPSNQMLNNWYDRCCNGMAVNFDCPGLVLTEDGVNWCELFWNVDLTRRAKLWDEMNDNERREILRQLNILERLQLFRILSDVGLGALFDLLKDDGFEDIWKRLSDAERAHWFLCLDDTNRDSLILLIVDRSAVDCLKANEIFSFLSYNVGSDGFEPLIRILNDRQLLEIIKRMGSTRDCNFLWQLWNMLDDVGRKQIINNLCINELMLLFSHLKFAGNRNGNEEVHRQIVSFLGAEQCIELFFLLHLRDSDSGRILLWKLLSPEIRRIVWDIMNIANETQNERSQRLCSYLNEMNLGHLQDFLLSCKGFFVCERHDFFVHLDRVGYRLLTDILKTDELIQLWLSIGRDAFRVLLWYSVTSEERKQLSQSPDIQRQGPSWLISSEGGIVQRYRALWKNNRWDAIVISRGLDEKILMHCFGELDHVERVDLVCALANTTLYESGELSKQLWVNRMNDFERASVWGGIKTEYRARFWIALWQTNQADALSHLRQDEYKMIDRLSSCMTDQSKLYLSFENWTILKPEDRANSFWLLLPDKQEEVWNMLEPWAWKYCYKHLRQEEAWNMLEPWAWKYCYKHLSTPLKAKYWNSLTPELKQYNIWYFSGVQRRKLFITSPVGTKIRAFLPNEISMDRRRFSQLSVREQDDFYKRVTASVYSE